MNHDLMNTLTMDHDGDRWGWALGHHFDIAEALYVRGEDIPDLWDFRPSPFLRDAVRHGGDASEHVGNDWMHGELAHGLDSGAWSADDLRHAGNVLHRYLRCLRIAGLEH